MIKHKVAVLASSEFGVTKSLPCYPGMAVAKSAASQFASIEELLLILADYVCRFAPSANVSGPLTRR